MFHCECESYIQQRNLTQHLKTLKHKRFVARQRRLTNQSDILLTNVSECSICLEQTKNTTQCNHLVCEYCLKQWKQTCQIKHLNYSCPICRVSIVESKQKKLPRIVFNIQKIMVVSTIFILSCVAFCFYQIKQ